jgi:GWxTD domain-containing protein
MKKAFFIPVLLLLWSTASAGKLTALFSYCAFDVPGGKPYVELYLQVVGTTVNFVPAENMKKGQIEVQWTLRNADSIVFFDKYNLNSPLVAISDSMIPDFIDQQRIQIGNGKFEVELSIRDKNSTAEPVSMKQEISIDFPTETISLSDIELLENFNKAITESKLTKSGYDLVPSADAFFPKDRTGLKFYAEIYRSDKVPADEYLVRYYLSNAETKKILSAYGFNVRQKPASTNVIMGDIPITELQSGNYYLNVEIRNKKNEMLAFKSALFKRSNPPRPDDVKTEIASVDVGNTFVSGITSVDSLAGLIDVLYPISVGAEVDANEYIISQKDVTLMQKYLYSFWQKRSPEDPESAFHSYMKEVDKANKSFSALGQKGYATDRGRVYLQYGPPNEIAEEKYSTNAKPYEIWQYYKLNDQSNRKFVFACLEVSSDNYELIHSDARGEIQNNQWEKIVSSEHKGKYTIDEEFDKTQNDKYYGTHSTDKFNNPH